MTNPIGKPGQIGCVSVPNGHTRAIQGVRRVRQGASQHPDAAPDLRRRENDQPVTHFTASKITPQRSDLRKYGCVKCVPLTGGCALTRRTHTPTPWGAA